MAQITTQIKEAARLLREGEVVAIPTETVYGLGADATNDAAVTKIFEAKGRPSDNPLIVHIASLSQLDTIVSQIPPSAQQLMSVFWPGPLTIIFPKNKGISEKVTVGLDTVGIRMPDHPIALEIIRQANRPIAAPSANTSGRPSPTTAKHVQDDLKDRISLIVDGGMTGIGVESTVIDCSSEPPIILRPGGVSQEEIEAVIGNVEIDKGLLENAKTAPRSPGMKYTHYAPQAPLYIVEGGTSKLSQQVALAKAKGLKVGILATEETKNEYTADVVLACGSRHEIKSVAQNLYDTLRRFDDYPLDIIFSETFPTEGIGQAVMNRLIKAAGHQIIK